jgi:hypothetical protein
MADVLARYVKDVAGIDLPTFTSRSKAVKKVQSRTRPQEVPVQVQDPPTLFRWLVSSDTVSFYPSQKYSFRFETNCNPDFWKTRGQPWGGGGDEPLLIQVACSGPIRFAGGSDMKGGRARCYFQCSEDATPGDKATIRAIVQFTPGSAPQIFDIKVDVIENRKGAGGKGGSKDPHGQGNGGRGNGSKVTDGDIMDVVHKVLMPQGITRTDGDAWHRLQWGEDPSRYGLAIRMTGGSYNVFYNAEDPTLLEHQHEDCDARLYHDQRRACGRGGHGEPRTPSLPE